MLHPDQRVLDDNDGLVPLDKWQKTVDVMARIFKAPAGFVVQYTPHGYQVVIASNQESNPYPAGVEIPSDTNIFCKKVVLQGEPLYVQNAPEDPEWDTNPEVANDGFRSYLGLPLNWPSGEPFGTICVMDYASTAYGSDYVDLVGELRDLIEADLEILSQFQEIANLAMTDDLTRLFNRRGFMTVASHYTVLAKRSGLTLGLLYLDMDGLKVINDEQGHDAGDKALVRLASAIKSAIRENDVSARLSGDEFAILAVVNGQEEIEGLSKRIRDEMTRSGLSVSVGGVLLDTECSLEESLKLADKKMYQQKRSL